MQGERCSFFLQYDSFSLIVSLFCEGRKCDLVQLRRTDLISMEYGKNRFSFVLCSFIRTTEEKCTHKENIVPFLLKCSVVSLFHSEGRKCNLVELRRVDFISAEHEKKKETQTVEEKRKGNVVLRPFNVRSYPYFSLKEGSAISYS